MSNTQLILDSGIYKKGLKKAILQRYTKRARKQKQMLTCDGASGERYHFLTAEEADASAAKVCSRLWNKTRNGKQNAKKNVKSNLRNGLSSKDLFFPRVSLRLSGVGTKVVGASARVIRAPTKAKGAKESINLMIRKQAHDLAAWAHQRKVKRAHGFYNSDDDSEDEEGDNVDGTMNAAMSLILLCADRKAMRLSQAM